MIISNQKTKWKLPLLQLANRGFLHKAFIAALLASIWVFCLPSAFAAEGNSTIPLCASVKRQMGSLDVEMAILTVFGPNAKYLSTTESDADDAPPCQTLAALLRYDGAEVLVTSHTDGGFQPRGADSYLSAYILRYEGGAFRFVGIDRNFGTGEMSGGGTGNITAVRLGSDDGMMVKGGSSGQGFGEEHSSFYTFVNGGIASLGYIPTEWDNSGTTDDPRKIISINGKFDLKRLQNDRVPVTYTRKADGRIQIFKAIWHSVHGKFVLESGSAPKEIMEYLNIN
ncbi:MAG: hypothetical protein ACTHJ1_07655 [Bordetella sp.]|uniref:hypothetical protein n=1 Tax=Bordetella sp. TaxID=28081 RepID=UPI003F7C65C0